MAEKDNTEARCPACRTSYDKDRVIKVASASSERCLFLHTYSSFNPTKFIYFPALYYEMVQHISCTDDRIIAEVYSEKKQRSQRTKPKISPDCMKHLSGVRVMQKNLVYITGLPANLCNESVCSLSFSLVFIHQIVRFPFTDRLLLLSDS